MSIHTRQLLRDYKQRLLLRLANSRAQMGGFTSEKANYTLGYEVALEVVIEELNHIIEESLNKPE